jgi:hypothetical protein
LIYFIYQQKKYSTRCKKEKNDFIDEEHVQDLCIRNTTKLKFYKRTFLSRFSFICFATFVFKTYAKQRKTTKLRKCKPPRYTYQSHSFTMKFCVLYIMLAMCWFLEYWQWPWSMNLCSKNSGMYSFERKYDTIIGENNDVYWDLMIVTRNVQKLLRHFPQLL